MTTFAFTGHRPKDLPVGFNFQRFAIHMDVFLNDTFEDIHFVTGGALGIDTYAAEYAIRNHIPLTIILPFRPQVMSNFWNDIQAQRLLDHIQRADDVQIILDDGTYDVRAYQRRNEEMVNRADEVIAFWSGKKFGGTANCIRYALQVHKPVYNLLANAQRVTAI